MKLQVTEYMTIAELQEAFNTCFPFLSLSFFTKPKVMHECNPAQYLITEVTTPLKRIEEHPHSATVDILGEMAVGDLEQMFEKEFGLHVQVARKDGHSWVDLSLNEQNANAAQGQVFASPAAYSADYHDPRTEWYLG